MTAFLIPAPAVNVAAVTETQGWFIVAEVGVLALAALRGLIGR